MFSPPRDFIFHVPNYTADNINGRYCCRVAARQFT